LASSHDLSPLREYNQLHPLASEPAAPCCAPSARVEAPKSPSARVGNTSEHSQEAIRRLSARVRIPKDPSTDVENASELPENPSAKVNRSESELRRAPQHTLSPRSSSGGTHQQTSAPLRSSEELFSEASALRGPWNPTPNIGPTAELRRELWRNVSSDQSSGELRRERPTHREDPKNLLKSHQLISEHSVELFPGLRGYL
jgi:hypothetical protein